MIKHNYVIHNGSLSKDIFATSSNSHEGFLRTYLKDQDEFFLQFFPKIPNFDALNTDLRGLENLPKKKISLNNLNNKLKKTDTKVPVFRNFFLK